MIPSDAEWEPPREFDEYLIVQRLGRGASGLVYLAYDALLARHVAAKFIAARADDAARQRFLVEARAAARVQHPNVVTVYRVGELNERPFLISEYVRGQALDRLARPVPWARALELGVGLARGLAAAHKSGVLHRDIKPANCILAEDGNPKLLDFGLAKLVESTQLEGAAAAPAAGGAPAPGEGAAVPGLRTAATLAPPSPSKLAETLPPTDSARTILPAPAAVPGRAAAPLVARTRVEDVSPSWTAQLTIAGTVMGTPNYLSPEGWRGEPATPESDVYSLGVVLFELCAGAVPLEGSSLEDFKRITREQEAPPLAARAPGVDPRFAAIVDRCLRREAAGRYPSGEELREALEQLQHATRGADLPPGNPYRGLRAFEAEHRALFFGRKAEVGAVLDRLLTQRFVFVTSDSGVGKSSLCRAGVLPLVVDGVLEGAVWKVATLFPGRRPLAALCETIAAALGWDQPVPGARLGRELRARLAAGTGLVIFVDQLEELLTQSDPQDAEVAGRVLRELAVSVPRVRLLATLRADFLTRLASLPALGQELSRGLFLLTPLSPEGIREAIVGPATATGVRFESEAMTESLVQAATAGAGGLPLLQFALAELWEARDVTRQTIPVAALEAIGGVSGALARHADALLAGLRPAVVVAARRTLTHLVSPEGLRVRRSQTELGHLDPHAPAALEALVHGRLIVAYDADNESAYEIAHEALVDGWGTLREWLHEDTDRRIAQDRLGRAVENWERLGRSPEALWGVRQLAEARHLGGAVLLPRHDEFLRSSRRRARRQRVLRYGLAAGSPLLVLFVYLGTEYWAGRAHAQTVAAHVRTAQQALTRARSHVAEAARARQLAFTRFDALERGEGELAWSEARELSAQAQRAFVEASQALEAALAVEPQRRDVRSLFAAVIYERALLAEGERQPAQRDELVARLSLYDEGGDLGRRWAAPATLALEATPAGARAHLERYVDHDGRFELVSVADLGGGPVAARELPQGSYLLTLTAPGHATVRLPLLAGRGERVSLRVHLPPASAVPPGFVYVPPGRFLFGSAADDSLRRNFFETTPERQAQTGAFLIAENEVTYAEWIRFLDALPAAERAARTPRVAQSGQNGGLELAMRAGVGWELSLQPGQFSYHARLGEELRYTARKKRALQDWARMPVTGISAEDAQEFLAWLVRSGQLPKARLCAELEWERAARGADGREFPHGNRLEPDDANFDETYGKDADAMGPDEVGSYPRSRSPFGVNDLVGNAFEWTLSSLAKDEYVARGGSSNFEPNSSAAMNRHIIGKTLRESTLGLRVCADPPELSPTR